MRIAFLTCPGTEPGSPVRRDDAFEHDLMIAALGPAFAAAGLELAETGWREGDGAFAGCEAVLLGTAWDYHDHPAQFLARIEALARQGIMVCNPPELVRWNSDKGYLRDLAAAGAPAIPTLWPDDPAAADITRAFDHFGCDRVVVKRRVGAGAEGQVSFTRDAPPPPGWRYGHRALVQLFLPAITAEGETSFIFIDGAFSHALRKLAAPGDYRIQSLYGGREEPIVPPPADVAMAASVVGAIPGAAPPLYARIDMVRHDGQMALMEAELIEPYLYPEQGPGLGERLAAALVRRLGERQ